jgi:DNA-directed RNA polymerase delta subunit
MFIKNALPALYTSLMRHQEVCRVSKNTWGLKKWYPHLKDKKKNGSTQEVSEQADEAGDESSEEDV